MLRNIKDLKGYAIQATDGAIGHVSDFFFDDETWVVRYLVVDTGNWLMHRKVLISPLAFGQPNWTDKELPISLTKEQVKNSPDIDTEMPVSRQHEIRHLSYYGYPYYWGEGGIWGEGTTPGMMMTGYGGFVTTSHTENEEAQREEALRQDGDSHLRSYNAVMDYHIQATDGGIGHIQSLLVDQDTWAIHYFVVETSNWWLGHQVLIPAEWIDDINWAESIISVDLTRQAVKDAPPYDAEVELDRDQESEIHEHYGRIGYWAGDRG
ncbi:PRC-barrel domain-containing protein [Collimonas sp. NPDC087041]|uniref:PRC-barrel domain-containing protein n=1 Tax=Collimonas sp. NPDC087041 TaxID=3363960 RepID=UPI0037F1F254